MRILSGVCLLLIFSLSHAQASKKVLYLGDSLSMGAFGRTLDHELRRSGYQVYTSVVGGGTPYFWLKSEPAISTSIGYWEKTPKSERRVKYKRRVPKVEDLMDKYKPDVVVVQTGINLYATLRSKRRTKAANIREVESLIDKMCRAIVKKGGNCYWISAPDSHVKRYPRALQNEMTAITRRVVSKYGVLFDSGKVTRYTDPYPGTDGIHYGPTEARLWAAKVLGNLSRYLKHPSLARSGAQQNIPTPPSDIRPARPYRPPVQKAGACEVNVRLAEKSELKHLDRVTYKNAFALYEYDVVRLVDGVYDHDKIRVAHMVVMNRKRTRPSQYKVGFETSMALVPLDNFPSLKRTQMIDTLDTNLDLPIYVAQH